MVYRNLELDILIPFGTDGLRSTAAERVVLADLAPHVVNLGEDLVFKELVRSEDKSEFESLKHVGLKYVRSKI